ncbi:hypothetical protein Tco_0683046 [Tanacetum coccineum]|uniref:Uncharacterized protein n=1 Tax=Tanacetum coccineum TaxID=301880 RepID=A0ABQ4XTT9_9ASTR
MGKVESKTEVGDTRYNVPVRYVEMRSEYTIGQQGLMGQGSIRAQHDISSDSIHRCIGGVMGHREKEQGLVISLDVRGQKKHKSSKDVGLPRWQSVCFNFDPRAKKGHPMIGND